MAEMAEGWELRGKPPTLFRRFSFERYAETRDFGTTYVNITLEAGDGVALTEADHAMAARINELSQKKGG